MTEVYGQELGGNSNWHPGDIKCECNDPACPEWGEEGEVSGHIESCPCQRCHTQLATLRSTL